LLDFIHRYMPDWAIRVVIGLVVWLIACYYITTPFIYDRVTYQLHKPYVVQMDKLNDYWKGEKISSSKKYDFARCVYSSYYIDNAYEINQWVASIGFYKPKSILVMGELINLPVYKKLCGKKPWKSEA
jgi:hypothetical protein